MAARTAVAAVASWARDPEAHPRPSRADVAAAVRLSIELLAQDAPGQSVEVRVPPFAAVQCVAGPVHRRGTPPNVVQCDPITWLRLAMGDVELVSSSADLSGTRAGEVAHYLPLLEI
ncbi:hypothetical protein CWC39_06080 [Corynebacterium heidelbergense]|uniref:Bacterial SCP orthologue domain-containing protein n=1 Tax=Corynebacterium heidelbergense TaxID=2055947 RepID=A0A364VBG5_9CORY|nr:sterol carrier family protein [Corynebacterium heidelbergense]RAV33906.1 hypothetical protein CWC39_06080 [Corynebacterium heidelbergense]